MHDDLDFIVDSCLKEREYVFKSIYLVKKKNHPWLEDCSGDVLRKENTVIKIELVSTGIMLRINEPQFVCRMKERMLLVHQRDWAGDATHKRVS